MRRRHSASRIRCCRAANGGAEERAIMMKREVYRIECHGVEADDLKFLFAVGDASPLG